MSAAADSVETWSGKDRGDENFPVGSFLIRADLRPHIHAFYAFARNADDIADSPDLAPDDKIARLSRMESVLIGQAEIGQAKTGAPSALALRASLAATGVPPVHAQDLLTAFRQDAKKTRYATYPELFDYCRSSAMPVGRHVLALHGESEVTWPPSDALCAALQILNHLQDAKADLATLNRCYLPQELLTRHASGVRDLEAAAETAGLRAVFNALLDECDRLILAAAMLPRLTADRRLRVEVATIVRLARRLATRLRRQDPVATRVKLTRADFAVALLAAARRYLA